MTTARDAAVTTGTSDEARGQGETSVAGATEAGTAAQGTVAEQTAAEQTAVRSSGGGRRIAVTAGLVLALWVVAVFLFAGLHVLLARTTGFELFDTTPGFHLPSVPGFVAGVALFWATQVLVRRRHPKQSGR